MDGRMAMSPIGSYGCFFSIGDNGFGGHRIFRDTDTDLEASI